MNFQKKAIKRFAFTFLLFALPSLAASEENNNSLLQEYKDVYHMATNKGMLSEAKVYTAMNSYFAIRCNRVASYKEISSMPSFEKLVQQEKPFMTMEEKKLFQRTFMQVLSEIKCN